MAVDAYLQIDGIKGESLDDKFKDTIEILSFSWGASNPTSVASGTGGGSGKVTFSPFSIHKEVDKASPLLMLACANGQHFKSAVLHVRKQGGGQQEYYTVTLTDVIVGSYVSAAGRRIHKPEANSSSDIDLDQSQGSIPLEAVDFNYSKITFEYKPQKGDGSLDSAVSASWDIKSNKKG